MDEYDSGRENFLEKTRSNKKRNTLKSGKRNNLDDGTFREEYRRNLKHRNEIYNFEDDSDE